MKRSLKILLIFLLAGTLCGYKSYNQKKKEMEKQKPATVPASAPAKTPAKGVTPKKEAPSKKGAAAKKESVVKTQTVPLNKFVGVTALNADLICRPDKCNDRCLMACNSISDTCKAVVDIGEECLTAHKPQPKPRDAAEFMLAMQNCLKDNRKEYEAYRCTFSTSELDHRMFISAEKGAACQGAFLNYQKCLQVSKPDLAAVKLCQDKFRGPFERNNCTLATQDNTRRIYTPASANEVKCYIGCAEFPK